MKLKSKHFEHYKGKVYDLTVENSHTYNVESLSVHNSACGSLVSYALGITDLDPIKHGLMFERFLDPARSDMVDIDVDYENPDRVKDVLAEIYGSDNVASLSTFGTFQIKGLLKDLSRVYDIDHNETNQVNKLIEQDLKSLKYDEEAVSEGTNIALEDIERVSKAFNGFCEKYPEPAKHIRLLYGKVRHVGRHAAGVVIGDDLKSETAIFKTRDKETGGLVTQASFTEGIASRQCSAMGLVKFDLLGLATLKVIHKAVDLIAQKGTIVLELEDGTRRELLHDEQVETVNRGWVRACELTGEDEVK